MMLFANTFAASPIRRKLTKIAQLRLRFVGLFHPLLNKAVQNDSHPIW
jgi:hypothetical protein